MADKKISDLTAAVIGDFADTSEFPLRPTAGGMLRATLATLVTWLMSKGFGVGFWPFITGWYYELEDMGADLAGTSTMGAGFIYASIGYLRKDTTIAELLTRTGATVTASANMKLAWATVDPLTMKPKMKLFETASFAAGTANTNYNAALSGGAQVAPRGLIACLTIVDQNTTSLIQQSGLTNSSLMASRLGSSTIAGVFNAMGRVGWSATGITFPTIPTDLTTLTWSEDLARSCKHKFKVG